MSVGDVNSTAKGSGVRYNNGKPPMELIPLWIIASSMAPAEAVDEETPESERARAALALLGHFQMRDRQVAALFQACRQMGSDWATCAKVFDYGRRKYAEWNWLKGMKWSVPIACAARHLLAMMAGEELDPESGLPHRGHVLCNLVMLITYNRSYQEGDDRPPEQALTMVETGGPDYAFPAAWINGSAAAPMPGNNYAVVNGKPLKREGEAWVEISK